MRAERPSAFVGDRATYQPIEATGPRRANVLGFIRGGEVAVIATRFSTQVDRGWGATEIPLPAGTWCDTLTSRTYGHRAQASDLFVDFPVVLLEREGSR